MNFATLVCCKNGAEYGIQVSLFGSRRSFLRYIAKKSIQSVALSGKGLAAKMLGYGPEIVATGHPIAELVFYDDHFKPNDIAHEVVHAMMHIFREERSDPCACAEHEEAFATLCGDLLEEILAWGAELKGRSNASS
jgi:hypothetical protein